MKTYTVIEKTDNNAVRGTYPTLMEAEVRRNCLAIDKFEYYKLAHTQKLNETLAEFVSKHFEIKEHDIETKVS